MASADQLKAAYQELAWARASFSQLWEKEPDGTSAENLYYLISTRLDDCLEWAGELYSEAARVEANNRRVADEAFESRR